MSNLPVILDAKTGPNILRKDQMTPFLKTEVGHDSDTTRIYDNNDKPLRLVCSIKLYFLSEEGQNS